MSHRIWWLVSLFALVLGAAIEFDLSLAAPQQPSPSAAQPAPPAASVAAKSTAARRS